MALDAIMVTPMSVAEQALVEPATAFDGGIRAERFHDPPVKRRIPNNDP